MMGETSFAFDFETNSGILKELINTRTTKFQMGVDYGNGDIQTIGTFELLPNKITNYKRKKKGKRYIIYKYDNDKLIVKKYKKLKSCTKVGKLFNMSGENVRQVLIRNNVERVVR